MPTIEYWRTTPKMDGIERWITERKLYPQLLSNYRTKTVGKHLLIFGCPIGKYSNNRCLVNIRLQSINHPIEEFKEKCTHGKCIVTKSFYNKRR